MSYTLEFVCVIFNDYSSAACKIESFSTEIYSLLFFIIFILFLLIVSHKLQIYIYIYIYQNKYIKNILFYIYFEWIYPCAVLLDVMYGILLARMTMINAEEHLRMWIPPWRFIVTSVTTTSSLTFKPSLLHLGNHTHNKQAPCVTHMFRLNISHFPSVLPPHSGLFTLKLRGLFRFIHPEFPTGEKRASVPSAPWQCSLSGCEGNHLIQTLAICTCLGIHLKG